MRAIDAVAADGGNALGADAEPFAVVPVVAAAVEGVVGSPFGVSTGAVPAADAATDAECVDDSVYTNVTARRALRIAEQVGALTGHVADPAWERTATALRVPFDSERGLHPEFAGYQHARPGDAVLRRPRVKVVAGLDGAGNHAVPVGTDHREVVVAQHHPQPGQR